MRDSIENLRRVDPGVKQPITKISFSKTEIAHIFAAVLILTIAFTIILYRGSYLDANKFMNVIKVFGISLILVTFSFLLHELGHKFVAQQYGAWSEFRAYPMGLLISLVFSFMGFLFAAPGAVYIRGNINQEQNAKISLAGPGVNFIICAIAIILTFFTSGLANSVILQLAWLNAFLGLFNMIPIPPLDGSKIVTWSLPIYILAIIIGVAELAATYTML
ncbi:MAG: site-2 protease family protein [Candidatus Methanomethylophilaceae archaeon]|nr:site-2 protease family protein [Candidatus Methanomethylophilaceae archaeon]MDD3379175.1 site-2 protease family protein [Candidatus Methanomethylophilaceae archaeon]MDY0224416.1 site-2 protease family protein [Candidatus Methanomethylophilaceae archaeon]